MKYCRLPVWVWCGVSVLCGDLSVATAASPLYAITKVVPIGAPDSWDLLTVDGETHRVYIAHGDRVTVVDGFDGAVVGTVDGYAGGTHGVAVAADFGRGYSDDGKAGLAGSFDLRTLQPRKSVKAEADADAVIYDPASKHVFVVASDPGKITVIDPETDLAIATIDGGGKLELGAADGAGRVYVNGEERQEILSVDTRTNQIAARWPIPSCVSPHGLAVDPRARRIFSTCENSVMVVVDAESGKQIASLPIGARSDGAAFDTSTRRAFSSNGEGTLTVIAEREPNVFVVLGTVPTRLGARTMTVDSTTGRLYLVAADMKLNATVDSRDVRHRYTVVPGSAVVLFLDPLKRGNQ
jgi:DNA-binding beta-propeller fold protein YncE